MRPSEKAFELIKQFEGLRLRAYKALPTEKYYTIGYGHYGSDVRKNQVITVRDAETILHSDVMKYATLMSQSLTGLTQWQYDALVSLVYNIGWYNFRYAQIWNCMRNIYVVYEPIECARRIIQYVYAGGKIILGLQKRRCIEANYFMEKEIFIVEGGHIIEKI